MHKKINNLILTSRCSYKLTSVICHKGMSQQSGKFYVITRR